MLAHDIQTPTIKNFLQWAHVEFGNAVSSLEAEVLLAMVLGQARSYLHAWPTRILTDLEQESFKQGVARLASGEPLAYITGQREFWSLNFRVTKDTLIPRPETELLVEWILKTLPVSLNHPIADLGTGCGAVALALAHERRSWEIHATDIMPAALAIARENARRLELSNVQFHLGDWCAALPKMAFAAIISNPPYVSENDPDLSWQAARFEPHTALVSSDAGLGDIGKIAAQARSYLLPKGYLLLEHGNKQGARVRELLRELGYQNISTYQDLSGWERATSGQF